MSNLLGAAGLLILIAGVSVGLMADSRATRYTSPNYTIDAGVVGGSVSGMVSGGNYQMVTSAGESIIGNGQAGSYRLDQGYVAQLPNSLQLTVSPVSLSIPTVTPGVSQSAEANLSVRTSATEYSVGVAQSNNLSNGQTTIPGVGSFNSPVVWNEGTTKGFGLTLASLSHQTPDAKWQSGQAYGSLPNSTTTLYNRTGANGGAVDTATLRYRLDVTPSQPSGNYSNNVTYTATWLP